MIKTTPNNIDTVQRKLFYKQLTRKSCDTADVEFLRSKAHFSTYTEYHVIVARKPICPPDWRIALRSAAASRHWWLSDGGHCKCITCCLVKSPLRHVLVRTCLSVSGNFAISIKFYSQPSLSQWLLLKIRWITLKNLKK